MLNFVNVFLRMMAIFETWATLFALLLLLARYSHAQDYDDYEGADEGDYGSDFSPMGGHVGQFNPMGALGGGAFSHMPMLRDGAFGYPGVGLFGIAGDMEDLLRRR